MVVGIAVVAAAAALLRQTVVAAAGTQVAVADTWLQVLKEGHKSAAASVAGSTSEEQNRQ